MQDFYFAKYRLLIDDRLVDKAEWFLSDFRNPTEYTNTFTMRMGDDSELDGIYEKGKEAPVVFENDRFFICKASDGWSIVIFPTKAYTLTCLLCSDDFSEVTVYVRKDSYSRPGEPKEDRGIIPLHLCIRAVCETAITFYDGIPLHASLIEKNGKGIIFTGPSGMGKSTQAKLWQKYHEADFISGDRPGLRRIDGVWFGNGMPWDGKDRLFRQKGVRLAAIVLLEQSDKNEISRLNRCEAMKVMMKQTAIPMWNRKATDTLVGLLGTLVSEIPFYCLKNKADRESTDIVYKIIMET